MLKLILIFLSGLLLGWVISTVISRVKTVDTLRVDTSDPDDGPYMFLELKNTPAMIMQKKYITLKVKLENFLSQE